MSPPSDPPPPPPVDAAPELTLRPQPSGPSEPPGKPRSLLSPAFWAGIIFGLVFILLGVGIAVFGTRLFPVSRPAPAAEAPAPPAKASASPAAPAARAPGSTLFEPAPATLPDAAALPGAGPETAAVNARLDRLEAQHRATLNAAAAALAVSALADAAAGSGAFADEVDAVIRVAPNLPDLQALRDLAVVGAPARAVLVAEFDDVAGKAATASRAPAEVDGPLARVANAFASLVTIRRVSRLSGSSPDAILARTERRVLEGDLQAALTELAALPPQGREATAAWRAGVERRLAVERRIGAVRSRALADLAQAERQAGGG